MKRRSLLLASIAAFGYALLYHACQFVPITLVGWLFLVRVHGSLGEATGARRPALEDTR